jgi:hypothetical protein
VAKDNDEGRIKQGVREEGSRMGRDYGGEGSSRE